uniref:RNA-dependent RNA polymerase n=2 Tax=Human picobirnavirus TaxID=145856 RepID=D6PT41_HPBV|nr:RNA-dependent RNA polymerase [Human picobirnavirus]
MPKKLETSFGNFFKLPNPGLRAYFQHVESGQPDEYRTPFYKGRSVQSLLKEWNSHLEQIQDKFPELYQFEDDLGKKVGPMSVMFPLKDRLSDIDSYYDSILLESKPISVEARRSAQREWADIAGIRTRGQSHTVELMKKSTNSGSPFFTKRSKVVDDTLPCYITNQMIPNYYGQKAIRYEQHLRKGIWECCAVLGWRGQEGGPSKEDVKQRVVWMFPFAVNVAELQLYQPLISAMQSSRMPHVPAWVSMESVDRAITKMFDTKAAKDLVICTDFSKFDQHFNKDLQDCAAECISYLFKGDKGLANWIRDIYPIKYNIPLAYDWGKIRTGAHGMASGSGGTNADETLAHRCLQHEAAISSGKVLNLNSQCLGDDGVLTYPGISVEDVMQAYTSHGLEMNESKQYASTHDCVYLRRWHDVSYRVDGVCVGVYSTNRALGRLCEQERYYDPESWGPEMVALRQLSILENCKYHPLKEEFADWCMKGDKYRLGLDIPGFLDKIELIAKKATDYMPDFLGYTKSLQADGNPRTTGISNWWIVNYLKSKA